MHKLGVNIDHVATLREARGTNYPDPLFAAMIAEGAGASNITLHVREDRRHAQERDLEMVQKSVGIKVNLEMAATDDLLDVALRNLPDSSTIVPEKREELTTEGGLDLLHNGNAFLGGYIEKLKEAGIEVSLFIDPSRGQIDRCVELGAEAAEFNTGRYSEAKNEEEEDRELDKIADAVIYAKERGIKAHVGHGLSLKNVKKLAALGTIEEFNIGHAIVARALFVGFENAVKEMLLAIGA